MAHDRTYASVVDTTCNTPLIELKGLLSVDQAIVLAKPELHNPFRSANYRSGRAMIEEAEARGVPEPGARYPSTLLFQGLAS